ncbi:DUF4845 domain-containing protein [Teredinibacter waterburyi]|uniref:DUF4845 domain-containing protein n=1 Tax=Teredinibacter waterburyi TaxID=1500538 RepID=UPI00165F3B2A|nr:DUF4845 domain-containing protein [Teredinibacter waterburyi]
MNRLSAQRGFSTFGWLVVLVIVGFFLTCFFKLGPHYLDNRYVVSALQSFADQDINAMDRSEIKSQLQKFIQINGIRGTSEKSFKVVRLKDRTLINSVYEERVHMFANVDVVLSFKQQLDSSNSEKCCKFLIETKPE